MRFNQRFVLVFVASLFLVTAVAQAERRALLVGISDYSSESVPHPAPEDLWPKGTDVSSRQWGSLRGAAADARAMHAMLRRTYEVPERNIAMLLDAEATRSQILSALESLIESSRPGDEILFYYSGHGSQIRSRSPEEWDGYDETIVPADSRRGAADIRDKKLRSLFNRLAEGVELTIIMDSCHSSSGVRGPGWTETRAVAPASVPNLKRIDDIGPSLRDRGAVIMAAALEDGKAYETPHGDGFNGAFTYALLDAMRLASAEASVGELFRRTRARLRVHNQIQEPTMIAKPHARNRQLFGGRRDRENGMIQVAVEEVETDGRLVLQGGWVNGLTVGSELALPGVGRTLARVIAVSELDRAIAIRVDREDGNSEVELEPGMLLALSAWAPPPGERLKVWVPKVRGFQAAFELAKALALRASAGAFVWVGDPASEALTHVLDLRGGSWILAGPDGDLAELGVAPEPADVETYLDSTSYLYVRLPPPASLRCRLIETLEPDAWEPTREAERANRSGIELARGPIGAHYVLASVLQDDTLRYAWVHASRLGTSSGSNDLPDRSDWVAIERQEAPSAGESGADDAVAKLHSSAKILARILGWLTLDSREPNDPFPYRLAIIERPLPRATGSLSLGEPPSAVEPSSAEEVSGKRESIVRERLMLGGHLKTGKAYGFVLWGEEEQRFRVGQERHVYVFTVDSFGKSLLLFPDSDSIENRFPRVAADAQRPADFELLDDADFKVVEPYGRDIYFLFTSSEPIHELDVFQWDGARVRGAPTSPLENLLRHTASGHRGDDSEAIPSEWSIERLVFDTGAGAESH